MTRRKRNIQMIRFVVVGCSNAIITYLVYVMMRRWLHCTESLSNGVGYVAALVNNFVCSKWWVFESRTARWGHEVGFFIVAFLLAYGCQYVFFKTLVFSACVNEYLAQFLGLFVYGAVNYMMNKRITFRNNNACFF